MYRTKDKKTLVLASQSPRRREILQSLGLEPEVIPSRAGEGAITAGESPADYVIRLATLKAKSVAQVRRDAYVFAADTVVVLDGAVFGKPTDASEAKHMLKQFSGRVHEVIGGYILISPDQQILWSEHSVTEVAFREIQEEEISWYINSGEPYDKAGGYGIQGLAQTFVRSVSGSYSNVVGLDSALAITAFLKLGLIECSKMSA